MVSDPAAQAPDIAGLPLLLAALPDAERARAEALFAVVEDAGEMLVPAPMVPWVAERFGPLDGVLRQQVMRVTNRWTYEGAVFNPLRANRPGAGLGPSTVEAAAVRERIAAARGDDFCHVAERTPADVFGRIRGRWCQTAANVARADGWHGVVVFDEHDPLAVGAEQLADALGVAREWAARAHALRPDSRHLFVLWNCLWRAGASLEHAHLQVLLSRAMPQARVALWRAAAQAYRAATGRDYFADLGGVHRALGLTVDNEAGGAVAFASLTPIKEREVVVLAPGAAWNRSGPNGDVSGEAAWHALVGTLGRLVEGYWRLGVLAFDLALCGPPLDGGAEWEGFPVVARLVDRGDPLAQTADVAAMELFGSSVVAHDPFAVARALREVRAAR